MAVIYKTRRPDARRKWLRLRRKRNGDLIVRTGGLGRQPKRRQFIRVTAGDRIRVFNKDVVGFSPAGTVDPVWLNQDEFVVSDTKPFGLVTAGGVIEFRVRRPPAQNPLEMELVGPGIYWAHADDRGLRRWGEDIAAAGMNYVRIIIPSHAWLPGYPQSIWVRRADGKYDLSRLDGQFLTRLRADCWYLRGLGVVVHFDLMDHHMLRGHVLAGWHRSEFCGRNNTLGYPMPREHYGNSWENVVEHALKGQPDHPLGYDYGEAILNGFRRFVQYIPPGHIVGDGNELESLTIADRILRLIAYGLLAYGGDPLWADHYFRDLEPPSELGLNRQERLAYIRERVWTSEHIGRLRDKPLMWSARLLCLHQINADNAEEKFIRMLPVLEQFSETKVLFSTDGTGSGVVRGEQGRPEFDDLLRLRDLCRDIAGENYAGLGDIKVMHLADADALLKFWKEHGG